MRAHPYSSKCCAEYIYTVYIYKKSRSIGEQILHYQCPDKLDLNWIWISFINDLESSYFHMCYCCTIPNLFFSAFTAEKSVGISQLISIYLYSASVQLMHFTSNLNSVIYVFLSFFTFWVIVLQYSLIHSSNYCCSILDTLKTVFFFCILWTSW